MKHYSTSALNTEVSYRSVAAKEKAVETILSFSSLSAGWHYGQGVSISRRTIEIALFLANKLRQIGSHPTEAFPLVSGDILIIGYHNDEEVEVVCRDNLFFDFSHVVNDETLLKLTNIRLIELHSLLGKIEWKSKRSFGSSIRSTTAIIKRGFPVQHSADLPTAQEHQSFPLTVPFRQVQRNVIISEPTTQHQLPASHPFFYVCRH